jgi:hypothetical protein
MIYCLQSFFCVDEVCTVEVTEAEEGKLPTSVIMEPDTAITTSITSSRDTQQVHAK